jgi:hypothetical protein
VFLQILLLRILRHRTLCRSRLPIFWPVGLFRIFDFQAAALAFGFFTSFRRRRALLSEIEFHAEIAAIAPAAIEFKSAALIVDKREPQTFVFADRPIPAAVRIRNLIGKTANPRKWFVTYTNNVVVEVVERITHVPHELSATFALSIPGRWDRIICIFEPPDGI